VVEVAFDMVLVYMTPWRAGYTCRSIGTRLNNHWLSQATSLVPAKANGLDE
jgi:hypothetical protein